MYKSTHCVGVGGWSLVSRHVSAAMFVLIRTVCPLYVLFVLKFS